MGDGPLVCEPRRCAPIDRRAVGRVHSFPNQRIVEFWNCPTRFREWNKTICSRNEAGNDDRRVVRRVLTDERANRRQVGLRLLRPERDPHDRNGFLTSSWDTSWRASDWRRPSSIFAMKHSRSMARCFSVISMSTIYHRRVEFVVCPTLAAHQRPLTIRADVWCSRC